MEASGPSDSQPPQPPGSPESPSRAPASPLTLAVVTTALALGFFLTVGAGPGGPSAGALLRF